ncbi:hypothetical protein K470DRAFT_239030 [Piedraia hortae CBS 480.64]|uniref:C2H2-type domain-containing protein n=1 Tax=Piedraia hortae CBS 480.64 TaxID=1314780 RepID=A0A6A7BNQ3_9PEZI|nr:hypothetical protein K470DRAFT_239030 [Piedraia hortae CBS 480.64]
MQSLSEVVDTVAAQLDQQGQQAQQVQVNHTTHFPLPFITDDDLVCLWNACGKRCDTADALFHHVSEDHIGRKKNNNLCLNCYWGNCDVSATKRDHLTSHVRVHLPLRPHRCEECGKTFKRRNDLHIHSGVHLKDSQDSTASCDGNAPSDRKSIW